MLELLGISTFSCSNAYGDILLCVPDLEPSCCFNVSSSARIVSNLDSSPVRNEPHREDFEPAGAAIAVQSSAFDHRCAVGLFMASAKP